MYDAIGRGLLVAVKDGGKTLIVVSSIVAYCRQMKPAAIKAPAPREKSWPARPPAVAAKGAEARARRPRLRSEAGKPEAA